MKKGKIGKKKINSKMVGRLKTYNIRNYTEK